MFFSLIQFFLNTLRFYLRNHYINYRYDRRFAEDLRPPHFRQTKNRTQITLCWVVSWKVYLKCFPPKKVTLNSLTFERKRSHQKAIGVRRKKYTILSSTVEELNGIFGENVVLPAHSVIKYDLYSIPEALSINMIFVTFPKKYFFHCTFQN